MNKAFWGFFFTFANFYLVVGGEGSASRVNVLPDWLGYVLLFLAIGEIAANTEPGKKAKPWCIGAMILEGGHVGARACRCFDRLSGCCS